MTGIEETSEVPRKHRQRGKNRRIGFTQEQVTKNVAKTLLSHEGRASITEAHVKKQIEMETKLKQPCVEKEEKIKDTRLSAGIQNLEKRIDRTTAISKKENKRKEFDGVLSSPKKASEAQIYNEIEPFRLKKQKTSNESEELNIKTDEKSEEKVEENKDTEGSSKRAIKKIKHQKLLGDKKNKLDMVLKQKALNYISKWKHDKINWKFEKLKQIWLLQNLYDSTKIEDSIWDTVVEYFCSSKGKVHKTILDEAVKIVENGNDSVDNKEKTKLNRARDIIQNLQD